MPCSHVWISTVPEVLKKLFLVEDRDQFALSWGTKKKERFSSGIAVVSTNTVKTIRLKKTLASAF